MENMGIRFIASNNGVKLWEVAGALGISENTLTRKLRKPLSEADKDAVLAAIDRIKSSRINVEEGRSYNV